MRRASSPSAWRGARSQPTCAPVPASFEAESGVFFTVNTYPGEALRGCIGYPNPFYPLSKAIVKAAGGATEGPRSPAPPGAGAPRDGGLGRETGFDRFQSEIWAETAPRGPIVRRTLEPHARP